jgi:ERF superfamily
MADIGIVPMTSDAGTHPGWVCVGDITVIAPAWVAALGELEDIGRSKTADAGTYQYRYADLADATSLARAVLAAHDLAVFQVATIENREIAVRTTVMHTSGAHLDFDPFRLPAGNSAQQAGSAATYARRYALMAQLGLATDDDDGAGAAERPPPAAALWPAKTIKGGMVHEIAAQVTAGDLDRARELASFAWDTFALGDLVELPGDEAREKIDAALELARQEVAEFEAIAAAEHVPTIVHLEGDTDGEPTQPHPVIPPPMPWSTPTEMRADMKARGITTPAAQREAHAIAKANNLEPPEGSLDAIYRHPNPHFVAAFAAWVRNHDELETA